MTSPRMTNRGALNTTQFIIIALLFGFSMLSYFDRTIMSIAGPQMIKDFGISATQMGGIYSAFILGYALLMLPGGHLTDWLGPRITLTLMGVLSGLSTAAVVLAGRPGVSAFFSVITVLFVARLALGVVTAPLYPACAADDSQLDPRSFPCSRAGTGNRRLVSRCCHFPDPFHVDDGPVPLARIIHSGC